MSIKYFCDVCGDEMDNNHQCTDDLCIKCSKRFEKRLSQFFDGLSKAEISYFNAVYRYGIK